ncbi:Uncharacterised protein [Yersinia frederiksenii]|uniref:Uncharacterized protein n=1 Tax=Yersinia alsatica TaxID=2890317 RepID=A0ABY5UJ57_9GAMM|nr:hypothetical protein [Yersinia alsatica]CFQ59260.1 Uncharacterised protein [Yersinia frederiksenii]UWM43516.1 hypothetical protein N0H69_12320 [Yersinia alsatica]CNC08998.1 Uncharacterised protein [Yersinia frederiksenii]CNI11361.1 Uncharacterised protein [Yersinia frederiksenii]CNI26241.1 Uncharacterised protein [Yersinia frederiksenii]
MPYRFNVQEGGKEVYSDELTPAANRVTTTPAIWKMTGIQELLHVGY